MKANFTLIILLITLFKTDFCTAQNLMYKEASISQPEQLWHPIKLGNDGNNVLNGLHIYSVKSECNSEKVSFIKLMNVNTYAVKFSYQISPESPVIDVIVPASKTIEGSCNSTDNNIKNLIIVAPADKTEQTKKNKEYLRSHVFVTPI